jgi:hypothetical protein
MMLQASFHWVDDLKTRLQLRTNIIGSQSTGLEESEALEKKDKMIENFVPSVDSHLCIVACILGKCQMGKSQMGKSQIWTL